MNCYCLGIYMNSQKENLSWTDKRPYLTGHLLPLVTYYTVVSALDLIILYVFNNFWFGPTEDLYSRSSDLKADTLPS